MSETKTEEALLVLTKEDLKILPLTTQKVINELTLELNISALGEFNPIVKAMVELEEMKELKYIPDNAENAQAFTTNKVALGKFNASVVKAAKIIKAPLTATSKKVTVLEKLFKQRGVNVKDYLLKEFAPLIAIEEEKKAAKLAKKNKASTDKIEALSDESIQQKLIITRMNLKTKLDKELNCYVPDAVKKAQTFSKDALLKEIEDLKELKSVGFNLEESEKETLLTEQQEEIIVLFTTNIDSAIFILQTEYERPINVPVQSSPPPIPDYSQPDGVDQLGGPGRIMEEDAGLDMTAPSLTQSNPDFFKDAMCDIISEAIQSIENLNPAIPKETSVKDGTVTGLQKIQKQIIAYLSNE
jgi:hypothetical protein